ncbi:MAG: HlyD family efflux transporter periplasmic adaptor subunit, partial [Psychrosphaera sp.]|nr:HlyD family efflux transporter periplasmic adaptor subunit [Psychrosphaera sp.]
MDIRTTLSKKKKKNKMMPLIGGLGILVLFALVWRGLWAVPGTKLNINDLWITKVQGGDMPFVVSGFGRLKSRHQRILTSPSQATVEEIFHYPGDKVKKNTLLIRLADPKGQQEINKLKLEMARTSFSMKERTYSQNSDILLQKGKLLQLQSDLKKKQLQSEAEKKLLVRGIVSSMSYQRTELDIELLKAHIEIEQTILTQFEQLQLEGGSVQADLTEQMKLNFETMKAIIDNLEVRAGVDGILQSLDVKLGQSVSAGAKLASVDNSDELFAELQVPQRNAGKIKLGNSVDIDTFGDKTSGKVARIDPVVRDGRLLVEIEISELPQNARPELAIEGIIHVDTIKNTLFIKQAANIQSGSQHRLFKLSKDRSSAQQHPLQFGVLSSGFIQVVGGASEGDEFIVSDDSTFKQHEVIHIVNK